MNGRMHDNRQGPPRQEDGALVLVAIMNNLRDWGIVQGQGWYRIPLKRAPRQIGAEYLAFFHTAAFDEEKWSVRYYAPVRAVRLVRRQELLPEESRHPRANDLYYRFDLGPHRALERPVPSRRLRRITFIHTTLQRLYGAEDVSELWIKQPLRERLWVELNRQGIHAERSVSVREGSREYRFDFVIPCQNGNVAIDCRPVRPEDISEGIGREETSIYPLTPDEQRLAQSNWSWLHFEDPGWLVKLEPYLMQVWQEIRRRGDQR